MMNHGGRRGARDHEAAGQGTATANCADFAVLLPPLTARGDGVNACARSSRREDHWETDEDPYPD